MNRKIQKRLKQIVKVIKMFETDVTLFLENKELEFDELGNPIRKNEEKILKMAIMTPKTSKGLPYTMIESFISDKKEAYYILKENDDFKITENMKLKHNDVLYRVVKIENSYDIFIRMELNIDDKRN